MAMHHCLEKLWEIACADVQAADQRIIDFVQHLLAHVDAQPTGLTAGSEKHGRYASTMPRKGNRRSIWLSDGGKMQKET